MSRVGVRYAVSGRFLSDEELAAHLGGDVLLARDDGTDDPILTETEWLAAHGILSEIQRH